ncbi:MAG TPA: ABC transporter permease [Candidatus Bipolaricaulis sp.]|nr:ABC transporter permease [Candidatus Bipolaricaulis sp.]MDY0391842.1 ABC transporter permease [Candidatus Bipolaricaulis sp.]HPD07350.1 ABC transporter permease [Candidatus Bipolaricaulis sp.]HRS14335.1 ABC transporter permease [Candidatus Bipolaricaulis sp.]HRU21153.1 ABC transporter permease [Candidatus Bipolaricaulis sp.]
MKRYLGRKLAIYALTFFLAVTIDWMIPRFMPGNPVQTMLSRVSLRAEAVDALRGYYTRAFGLDVPVWQQYLNFWRAVFQGDLGVSIYLFPKRVSSILMEAVPYSIALLLPAILLSWLAGNKFGAFAARRKWLDNTLLPVGYLLTATPYMWLGVLLAWAFGIVLDVFPIAGAYSFQMSPHLSWAFIKDLLWHWFLPFASLFLVMFGGWAIGMRNMIIYELEADYSKYLESLGAPARLIRKYAFRNAMLPQITGLALQLGVIAVGAIVTEIVFSYPGIGHLLMQAIQNQDYFLIQGCFLFIIMGVLLANFAVDILYIIVDPRTRRGMVGES